MWTVYCHENIINGKRYVGITSRQISDRWRDGKGYHNYFGNAIKKYGWNNFDHVILFNDVTEKFAKSKEKELINLFNCRYPHGYNLTDGGDGNCGWHPSDETKKKISENQIGKHHHLHTEETKEKIRQAKLGNKSRTGLHNSEYHKQRCREAMLGNTLGKYHKVTDEYIERIKISQPNRHPVVQLTKSGEFIKEFISVSDAKRLTGVSNLNYCCNGKLKTSGGFRWMYLEDWNKCKQ
jgi:group I intron endonuclease